MAETDPSPNIPNQPPPGPTQPPEPQPPGIDPEEYNAMLQENAQYRALLSSLEPQAERIKRLRDDPNAAQLFDNALGAYENFQRQQAPRVPDGFEPLYDKVSKLEKFVDDHSQREEAERQRPQRELEQKWNEWQLNPANNHFFRRLMADTNGKLDPDDLLWLGRRAAKNNFEPLEETWKRDGWRFTEQTESAPPSSLRADVGEVGIPGETRPASTQQSMRQFIVSDLRKQRGIA